MSNGIFIIALGRHTDLHYQQLRGHIRHLHERSGHSSNDKILALFKDIQSGAKQNPVTRNAVVHLIPEQR